MPPGNGGLAIGGLAFGGLALGWNAAVGGIALAHDYAVGAYAQAAQANNDLARNFIQTNPFLDFAQFICDHSMITNLAWVIPMIFWWRALRKYRQQKSS